MKKQWIALLILLLMSALTLLGCSSQENTTSENGSQTTDETEEDVLGANTEKPAKESLNFGSFSTTDLDGNKVSEDIFADYDLTLVNFWATWCGPCVEEIPELAKLYDKLPVGVNLIGICIDAETGAETAVKILSDSKAEYTVLVANTVLNRFMGKVASTVPTTIFVDSEGNLIGDPVIGVPKKGVLEFYPDEIQSRLEEVK